VAEAMRRFDIADGREIWFPDGHISLLRERPAFEGGPMICICPVEKWRCPAGSFPEDVRHISGAVAKHVIHE